jgi:hypothetical protein
MLLTKLLFPTWPFACDQRGLYFQILNPLCILVSIFHPHLEIMRSISYSEAQQAPFWTANTHFLERVVKGLPIIVTIVGFKCPLARFIEAALSTSQI